MKFPEICRCRNQEKNIKKYTQQAAHNSESKLYLRGCFCETSSNGKRMREEITKKYILKITRHQVIRSLSLFGSVRSLSAVLSSIFVLNFSSIATFLFVASLMDPCTVTDPYSRALWAIKNATGGQYHSHCLVSIVSCMRRKQFFVLFWDAVMSGWQRQSKRKDENFDSATLKGFMMKRLQ